MTITQGWAGEGHGELVYRLEMPEASPSNNTIKGMNRFVYQELRQRWQGFVLDGLNNHLPAKPLEKSALIVVRHSSGGLDWDNAVGGLKPLIDCLVKRSARNPDGLGLVRDDNPDNMPIAPFVHQVKAKRGKDRTEVLLYRLNDSCTAESTTLSPSWLTDGDAELAYSMEFPAETPSNNTIKAMSSRAYRALRARWQYRVVTELEGRRPKVAVQRSGLVIVRHGVKQLDWDNAYGGLKPLLDCLVTSSRKNPSGLGLIQDDNPEYMPYVPFVRQVRAKAGEEKTELRIYRLPSLQA